MQLSSQKIRGWQIEDYKAYSPSPTHRVKARKTKYNERNCHFVLPVLDQIEQLYIPRFKSLSFNRQFEILVEGFEPDNPEMKKINSKIQRITQTFILQTKRFLSKPTVPLPPHH